MSVKERIKALRKELGLSQLKFAEGISISPGYIARIGTGDSSVNDRIAKLICAMYNVSEQWLKEGLGEMFEGETTSKINLAVSYFEKLNPDFQDYVLLQLDNLLQLQQKGKKAALPLSED